MQIWDMPGLWAICWSSTLLLIWVIFKGIFREGNCVLLDFGRGKFEKSDST
jgi:hypothetical protein